MRSTEFLSKLSILRILSFYALVNRLASAIMAAPVDSSEIPISDHGNARTGSATAALKQPTDQPLRSVLAARKRSAAIRAVRGD